jgi:magnesium chelatase family protein
MKILSLVRENDCLVPVEVEISFLPGLPQIQFLGLPDQVIKESIYRIKSAIRSQGFEFPKAHHILVNLRPSHLKKTSRGIELAVALGLIWESNQAQPPTGESVMVYGELSLNGAVFEPDDLGEAVDVDTHQVVWTGNPLSEKLPFNRHCISQLSQVHAPQIIKGERRDYLIERPQLESNFQFSVSHARVLKLVALGEHSLLLAGPSGAGKTTIAKTILSLLQEPSQEDMFEIINNNKSKDKSLCSWRPLVHPHHSTSPLGLIGGGVPPFKGDISRAHKGVLLLDELLEFNPRAQEALREPMEEFCIRIRRGRFVEEHPAETLVIATTNLCPCGDWLPNSKVVCGRTVRKCQSYLERLSGPLVDRFQILFFTQKLPHEQSTTAEQILSEIERVRKFRLDMAAQDSRFHQVCSRWSWEELTRDLPTFYMQDLFPKELSSRRRSLATLRVARTLADLEMLKKMQPYHIEQALKVSYLPFEKLKRLGS